MKTFFNYFKKLVKMISESDKSILIVALLVSLFKTSLMFVSIIYGGKILNSLVNEEAANLVLNDVYWLVSISGVLLILSVIFSTIYKKKREMVYYSVDTQLINKNMTMDYIQMESKATKKLLEEAKSGANSNGGLPTSISTICDLFQSFISIIYSIILISQLFILGNDSSNILYNILFNRPILSVLSIILVLFFVWLTSKLSKKSLNAQYGFFKENIESNRVFGYLFDLTSDYNFGKDFRIYDMNNLIIGRMEKFNNDKSSGMNKYAKFCSKIKLENELVIGAVMIISYLYVGIKASLGFIPIGSIISVATSIVFLNSALSKGIESVNYLSFSEKYMSKFDEYLKMKSQMYCGTLPIDKRRDGTFDLEFKDVSFKYPDTETYVLKNINFKIPLKKKLAVVGPNGAGKTTFIKLLSRLYDPTDGTITLNGIDIRMYDYNEYVGLLSIVFQDFKLFSASIAENVSGGQIIDKTKVIGCLNMAGFGNKLEEIKTGIDTQIYQKSAQGIEISGGEAQKIAIARALYKDAPIVILDEPTAALDPISEAEIYTKFSTLVKGKTAIYISHRMSSTRFCDQIIVFENGAIKEKGTHNELLKLGGLYKKMWDAQANYYK